MNLKTGCSTWAQAPGVLWAQGASFQGGNSVKYGNFEIWGLRSSPDSGELVLGQRGVGVESG